MRIIGIDPGLATTSWAIVEFAKDGAIKPLDFGVISTKKGLPVAERLGEIYKDMTELVKKFDPEISAVETLLFYNNAKTAIVVGEARGVVLLALSQAKLPIHEFTPLQVKSSVTGYGKADKKQVQESVMNICQLEELPKPDDAADAIAVAIAGYDGQKMDNLMNTK